jgi:hypothetical protein
MPSSEIEVEVVTYCCGIVWYRRKRSANPPPSPPFYRYTHPCRTSNQNKYHRVPSSLPHLIPLGSSNSGGTPQNPPIPFPPPPPNRSPPALRDSPGLGSASLSTSASASASTPKFESNPPGMPSKSSSALATANAPNSTPESRSGEIAHPVRERRRAGRRRREGGGSGAGLALRGPSGFRFALFGPGFGHADVGDFYNNF